MADDAPLPKGIVDLRLGNLRREWEQEAAALIALKREREQNTVGRNDEVRQEDKFQEEFHLLCRLQLVEDKNEELKIKEKLRCIQKKRERPREEKMFSGSMGKDPRGASGLESPANAASGVESPSNAASGAESPCSSGKKEEPSSSAGMDRTVDDEKEDSSVPTHEKSDGAPKVVNLSFNPSAKAKK